MELSKVYFKTFMTTIVSVPAEHLGTEISDYIKSYIKSLKGTILNGNIIIDLVQIDENYDYGICDRINHNGSVDFKVTFKCIVTCLTEESVIIIKLNKKTIPNLYSGECGRHYIPIIWINNLSINSSKFQIKDETTIIELENDKNIDEFSYFKCKVSARKLKNNNNSSNTPIQFILKCFLIDIATQKEIDYYNEQEEKINNNPKSIDDDINISNYV